MRAGRLAVLSVTAGAVLAALLGVPASADAPASAGPSAVVAAADAMVVHEVVVADGADASAVAASLAETGFDVVSPRGASIFVLGPIDLAASLTARDGLTYVGAEPAALSTDEAAPNDLDDVLPRRLRGNDYPTFYGGYRTVDGFIAYEGDLAAAYPDLVQVVEYGESWSGEPLRAVCLTADADTGCELDPDVDKARFLIVAQTHARELTTSELMWRLMTYLVDGYDRNARVTGLLDGTEVWVVPHVNPDGTRVVEDGITEHGTGSTSPAWQRKNLNDTYSATACSGVWASSQEGVDINRNFDVDWGRVGTSMQPCNLTYGGPEAASEPETTAQADLMTALFRDQRADDMEAAAPRSTTGAMLTLHSYSDVVLLPWGFTTDHTLAPNDAELRSYAFRMSAFNGYDTGTAEEILYPSSGATEDWAYAELGIAGYTFEIGPGGGACAGFFPAYSCQDTFWALNRDAFLYGAEAARKPYALSFGPTTSEVSAKLKNGQRVIKAVSDDDAYGQGVDRPDVQSITAGRLYVGKPPWAGGSPKAMKVKGSGSDATLKAKINAPKKRKLAYVQGRDASGEWGLPTPLWLNPE